MDLGESPRNKDGRHFHGNEAVFLSIFFIQIIIKKFIVHLMYNEMSGLKNEQQFFDQNLPLTCADTK